MFGRIIFESRKEGHPFSLLNLVGEYEITACFDVKLCQVIREQYSLLNV